MSGERHKMTYMSFDNDRHKARCTACGWSSFELPTSQAVQDAVRKHREDVERIKAHLGNRNPSLESQADYYREMADNASLDKEQRDQWKALADEIDRRLGRNPSVIWEDVELPIE